VTQDQIASNLTSEKESKPHCFLNESELATVTERLALPSGVEGDGAEVLDAEPMDLDDMDPESDEEDFAEGSLTGSDGTLSIVPMEQGDNALVELVKKDPHCLCPHNNDMKNYPDAKPEDALLHLRTMSTVAKIEQYARACDYNAGTGPKPSVLCATVIPEGIQEEIFQAALAELEKEEQLALESPEACPNNVAEEQRAPENRNTTTEHAHPSPPNKVTTLVPRSNKRKREDDEQQAQHENKKNIQVVDLCSSDDE
jgi:hypothetical protein